MIKKFICTALATVMLLVMAPMVVSATPLDESDRPGIELPRAVISTPCGYDVK